jgi:hypothetical protein
VVAERRDPVAGQAPEEAERLLVLGRQAALGGVTDLEMQRRRAEPLDVGGDRL